MNRRGNDVAFAGVAAGRAGDFGFVALDRVCRGAALREHEPKAGLANLADLVDGQ